MKKKPHHTHVVEEAHEEDQEEDGEEAENEEEGLSPVEEELEEDAMGSDEDDEAEEIEDDELKEAFAAGWKEKQKTAFARKNRGWKQTDNKENKGIDGQKSLDARKKVTTCSSCGKLGHWRRDSTCPNVQNGRDAPHKKAASVHFTYMVGGRWCSACGESLSTKANYCSNCGSVAEEEPPDARMSSGKRLTDFQECEDGGFDLAGEEEPEPFTYPVLRNQVLAAAMKAKYEYNWHKKNSYMLRQEPVPLAGAQRNHGSPEEGPRRHGYEAGRMEGVSALGARSSGSQAPVVPSKDKPNVF